jgi:hypothetical protein
MDAQTTQEVANNTERIIDAATFTQLLTSHRRLARCDRRHEHLRGLCDIDTGEVFLTDARKLPK